MTARRSSRRAFTLIEALAAIAVVAIIIPVLLEGFNVASNIAGLTRQTADATMLAQSVMDEMVSTGEWQYGTSPGEQRVGPTVYDVETTLDTWDDEDNVWQLTVTVHWAHRAQERQLALTTIVYVPATTSTSSEDMP